jgi:hypothetical protein
LSWGIPVCTINERLSYTTMDVVVVEKNKWLDTHSFVCLFMLVTKVG